MLFSAEEVRALKVQSITAAAQRAVGAMTDEQLDAFIKEQYQAVVAQRQQRVSDEAIKQELQRVTEIHWGMVQGQLDAKIQREYVRPIAQYDALLEKVRVGLQPAIAQYVTATWYNHWTTVLIENHIGLHPRVVPTVKHRFGIDLFFERQPFDLKITYLPRGYELSAAVAAPRDLLRWLYENQGEQRFGADNRLFVVLASKQGREESWKLKRDFPLVFGAIDSFFATATVSATDQIDFVFKKKPYTTHSKLLLITA